MPEQTEVEWQPTCEQAGCIGIRLPSASMCLAHAGEEETAAALKLIGETGEIDARGVTMTGALLDRILTAAPRGETEKPLVKGCRFDKATFSDDVGFRETTFSGEARFGGTTFSGAAWFENAIFNGNAEFVRAIFTGNAEFVRTTFSGYARFTAAVFRREADFGGATFDGNARFRGAIFCSTAEFGEAIFGGEARFAGAIFNRYAEFGKATFKRRAEFGDATFTLVARFGEATFSGDAWFERAIFSGEAAFEEATFSGDAVFEETTFNGNAHFRKAIFSGDAGFGQATFSDYAGFEGVRFEQARQLGPLLANRELVLDDVQFAQPVHIEVSTTGMCCRRARFPGGVQFQLRRALVVLDDTDLAAPSILAGVPSLSSARLARREEQIAGEWRPQLVSLRRANVAGVGLSNVTASDCRFAGAHNLDKLRLEANVSFAAAPSLVGLGGRRWGGREVIAEERDWRSDLKRSNWSRRRWAALGAPGWPGWLDNQRPSVLDPGQIAGLYRALRKGREDSKDEPGAADFYYGEMEMRRRARPGGNPDGQSGAASRGGVARVILTAYWLVSGYGLRAWRALAWLAGLTVLFAVALHLVGFAVPPRPVSYWTSLLYAVRATLSLTDNEVQLTAWGRLLQSVLRLTGPVLLGLALLALRGRVKR